MTQKIVFVTPNFVALLIPVLTSYPLFFAPSHVLLMLVTFLVIMGLL